MSYELVTHTLDPVCDENSRILILGTMPSPTSRQQNFYYSHPRNMFWQVIATVFDEPIPFSTEDKKRIAFKYGLALWDVLASCEIDGASDSSIKNPIANDFTKILTETNIKTIVTTGSQAHKLYKKLCRKQTGIDDIELPSTSPANTGRYPLNTLIQEYMILRTLGK